PKVPPSVVLGPDGKPCKPCMAFSDFAKQGRKAKSATSAFAAMAGGTAAATASSSQQDRSNCPADIEQLGRATWTFLHTAAAYYPAKPSPAHRTHMFSMLSALPSLYPCHHCAEHLGSHMKTKPPVVGSREEVMNWLCETHNEVNERLGKDTFPCTTEKLDERWKDGPKDGRCD
ncbi:FAD-dependent thiol oxidase, partial [Sistotremastrum niveocremeum HHB9708]